VLRALVRSVDFIAAEPEAAMRDVNAGIAEITGTPLAAETIAAAWQNLTFTVDPIADSLYVSAAHAVQVGLLDPVDLSGIYDLAPLNQILSDLDRDPVGT
jgi:NitT/TauT family transport system substrate-binding protein